MRRLSVRRSRTAPGYGDIPGDLAINRGSTLRWVHRVLGHSRTGQRAGEVRDANNESEVANY
jgi:hypothetical protein